MGNLMIWNPIKSIGMRWRQCMAHKGRKYIVLVGKPEGLTRRKQVQHNNIKMNLKRKWTSRHELDSSGSQHGQVAGYGKYGTAKHRAGCGQLGIY
jgi:hypothetical protein